MFFQKKSGGVQWLLVCLGNPGKEYANTRHNIGFLAADALEKRTGVKFNKLKYRALTGEVTLGGQRVLVVKPQTYMNLSGEAVKLAGFRERTDFMISLDAAASEWKNTELGPGFYTLPKAVKTFEREQLLEYWVKLADSYPIYSMEDPMDEEDWEGWRLITEKIGGRVRLVGDDLFVTNVNRLQKGITGHCANAILIKPNQIGTLTETMDAIQLARINGYTAIMSHRSGETEDAAIADLAVGMGTEFIKTGAPCRGERTAKYNQLLRIEEEIQGI